MDGQSLSLSLSLHSYKDIPTGGVTKTRSNLTKSISSILPIEFLHTLRKTSQDFASLFILKYLTSVQN
jgi:hypothetical protein